MDQKELVLLSYLRQNARMSLTTLSRKTRIPISTIFDRLKKTRGSLIERHVSLIDFKQLGFSVKISTLLKVGKNQRKDALEYLQKFFNINTLCKVNNGYDFLFEAIFHDLREVEEFFDGLESKILVKKKEIFYIVDDIKKESFFADPAVVAYAV